MITLDRFSERYQATGGLAAPGVKNQLGRPDMERIEVLVREAVQNCWDAARDKGHVPVEVEIGGQTLDRAGLKLLRERILPDAPPELPLAESLVDGLQILYFADFGTTGLGGPTRADVGGNPTDFVDFVRNIGQPPDKELGGGSYGYGKAAFYVASRAMTIIIDTYCQPDEERRLIAYGLGDKYREGDDLYTGRHWWGRTEHGVPEPVCGDEAVGLAADLGLPSRGPGDYGTTIAIVAPSLYVSALEKDLDLSAAMDFIADCLLWNFWPKMIAPPGGQPAMSFRLLLEGEARALENPRTHPRLGPFTEAMQLLRDPSTSPPGDPFSIRKELACHRPQKTVGTMALCQRATSATPDDGLMTKGARITAAGLHHVALMRQAELIVTYWAGAPLPVPARGYAGVFQCTVALDDTFCSSEPPTHDAWNASSLAERNDKRYVKACFNRLEEVTRDLLDTGSAGSGVGAAVAVGRFADGLAGLLGGLGGPGARRQPQPGLGPDVGGVGVAGDGDGAGGSAAGGPQIVQVDEPVLRIGSEDGVMIVAPFVLDTDGVPTRLEARVEVLTTDGGQVEKEPPIGAIVPSVLRWSGPDGSSPNGPSVDVDAHADGPWEVWVEHHPDLMVRVAIEAEPVEP